MREAQRAAKKDEYRPDILDTLELAECSMTFNQFAKAKRIDFLEVV